MSQITSPSTSSRPIAETDEVQSFSEGDIAIFGTAGSQDATVEDRELKIGGPIRKDTDVFNSSGVVDGKTTFQTVATFDVTLDEYNRLRLQLSTNGSSSNSFTPSGKFRVRNTTDGVVLQEGFWQSNNGGTNNVVTNGERTVSIALDIRVDETAFSVDWQATFERLTQPRTATAKIDFRPSPVESGEVFRWDAITFTSRGDVKVDIVVDGTAIQSDIDPGDRIKAAPDQDVAVRVRLQRQGTDDPALTSLYRRWIVGPTE